MQKGSGLITLGSAVSATAVMVNGDTLFTITGGPIAILALQSVCITANNGTASTLQYQSNPTVGSAATISGASASLASATAGSTVTMNPGTVLPLTTAPDLVTAANGGVEVLLDAEKILVQAGTIKAVIGVGSTTGTWRHYIAYVPLAPGVTVS